MIRSIIPGLSIDDVVNSQEVKNHVYIRYKLQKEDERKDVERNRIYMAWNERLGFSSTRYFMKHGDVFQVVQFLRKIAPYVMLIIAWNLGKVLIRVMP